MKYQSIWLISHENFSTKYLNIVSALWVVKLNGASKEMALFPQFVHIRTAGLPLGVARQA